MHTAMLVELEISYLQTPRPRHNNYVQLCNTHVAACGSKCACVYNTCSRTVVPALSCALGAKWQVMDAQTLVQALGNALDPNLRKQAEALLEEVGRTVWPSGC